ncbi:MAG: hypothetical protein R3D25_16125 [Geminicoccaceae bacterium]
MSLNFAAQLGNTFVGAFGPSRPTLALAPALPREGLARRAARALFQLPARLLAGLERRQRERDALVRYAMAEGRELGLGRRRVERAVLLTGRADMLFPSYFVNADRR